MQAHAREHPENGNSGHHALSLRSSPWESFCLDTPLLGAWQVLAMTTSTSASRAARCSCHAMP